MIHQILNHHKNETADASTTNSFVSTGLGRIISSTVTTALAAVVFFSSSATSTSTTLSSTSQPYHSQHPLDYYVLEREEHRWLAEQEDAADVANSTDTSTGGTSQDGSGSDTLATFSAVMTNLLLFFLIFCMSATVNLKELKHQLSNKFAIGTGVMMQFLFMPLLGFISVVAFESVGYTRAMGVSLLVVTASPGGSYSNWWCSLFNASLALSVGMTSVSSLLSIGLLPANLMLYGWLAYGVVLQGDEINIVAALDFGAIFITLGVVMGAIISGLYVSYKYDNATFHRRANHVGSVSGITLILFSAFLGSGVDGAETNFWSLPWSFYIGTAFPCVLGMSLASIVARSFTLPYPEIVAISIECCYQNTAIATSVAVTMFSNPTERAEAVSVPLFYGIVEAVVIGLYCIWAWKAGWTKAPPDEKLCVVMIKSYEVEDGEDGDENDLDFEHDEIKQLSFWRQCFVPKYRTHETPKERASSKRDERSDDIEDTRTRFYSADVTVQTNLTTPPGTPDVAVSTTDVLSTTAEDIENGIGSTVRSISRSILSGNMIPAVIAEGEEDSSLDGSTPRNFPATSNAADTLVPSLDSSITTTNEQQLGACNTVLMASRNGAPSMPDDHVNINEESNCDDEEIIDA